MNILIINPPVHVPTTYSYALAAMKSELLTMVDEKVSILDLNAWFHANEFKEYYSKLEQIKKLKDQTKYFELLKEFYKVTKQTYSIISKTAMLNKELPKIDLLLTQIVKHKPDTIAISVTYNSQIFYAKQIISLIQKKMPHIDIIIGGPADYSKILTTVEKKITHLANAKELAEHLVINGAKKKCSEKKLSIIPDFSDFNQKEYFSTDIVFPLRTSRSCPYKQCTFCTHHGNTKYTQLDISTLKETIIKNNIQKICFIDDDLTAPRLKKIAEELYGLEVKWWCQLRPTKMIQPVLKEAYQAGLHSVAWGLESGNQRILNLIKKGTKIEDIEQTLQLAHSIGIKNMCYVLFGFPTEIKEEFEDTITFLNKNKDYIDIVSPSIFGLQYGSKVMKSPQEFSVTNIEFEKRTFLSDKILYETTEGMTTKEVKKLKKQYNHNLQKINKVPEIISVFKEQILNH